MVMVKTAATADAAFNANSTGILEEGPPLVGNVKFSPAQFNGDTYIVGSATHAPARSSPPCSTGVRFNGQ